MMNLDWRHRASAAEAAAAAEFPQRGELFDPAAVCARIRAAGLGDFADCAVRNVWYVAGRQLCVVYALARAGAAPALVSVHFFRDAEAAAAYAAGPAGPGLVGVEGWAALAARFPFDPELPALPTLLDAAATAAHLPAPIRDRARGPLQWSLLSYLPGRRAVVGQRWDDGDLTLVSKLQPGAAASHRAMQALWQAPGRRFGMPEPVAAAADAPLRWERHVAGQRIEALLATQSPSAILPRVARGLAALHASSLSGLPAQGHAEVLGRLARKVLPRIGVALPALAARSADFAAALARAADTLPVRAPTVVHGDLHTANLLLAGDDAVFIDLDSLAFGDPAFDLALLGTRLILWNLDAGGGHGLPAAVAALPATYEAAGGGAVPEPVYAWYVAALLVGRQLKTCIRHLAPGLPRLAPALLAAAERILAEGRVAAEHFGDDAPRPANA